MRYIAFSSALILSFELLGASMAIAMPVDSAIVKANSNSREVRFWTVAATTTVIATGAVSRISDCAPVPILFVYFAPGLTGGIFVGHPQLPAG
jgi:hypothetical protein